MKHIKAIIKPEKLDEVKAALKKVGCQGVMTTEIEGFGQQGGIEQQWMGEKYELDLLPKTSVDVVVKDKDVDKIVNAIVSIARTGSDMGDGKIFIYDVAKVIRIRTGEEDDAAL
ncbi:MAG: P-II family nitrogen regulator [Clostridiales bacterium]|uniref:P-II family nitrogen regulator n=1 Tax=Clostridium sp. N3C TaxID=1776758 RepID=UPI00092DFA53|nr:P-II family nitrogen regulator [Clostridium sp. N3C]NLZ47563.1 P-II family nitrogen regulator [Clostridiales bacterium]SCN22621.1 Nitrogen regulatory protein P-II [Clostridium sp. N3C]